MSNCWKCGRELPFGVECDGECQPAGAPTLGQEPVSPDAAAATLARHALFVGADGFRTVVHLGSSDWEIVVRRIAS